MDQSKVNDISEDVPLICIFCNDRALNLKNDTQLGGNQSEGDHQDSVTASLPHEVDKHESIDSSNETLAKQ